MPLATVMSPLPPLPVALVCWVTLLPPFGAVAADQHGAARCPAGVDRSVRGQGDVFSGYHDSAAGAAVAFRLDHAADHDLVGADDDVSAGERTPPGDAGTHRRGRNVRLTA